jgi:hypothetical protein
MPLTERRSEIINRWPAGKPPELAASSFEQIAHGRGRRIEQGDDDPRARMLMNIADEGMRVERSCRSTIRASDKGL